MKEFYERVWKENPVSRWKEKDIKKTIKIIKPFLKNNCLDVGCANGLITNEINKIVPTQGIDISNIAIKKAKKKYPNIKFKHGSATKIPFKDNSFNTIFAGELIEHILDTHKMFTEFKRVLKPKGNLIIIAPEFDFIKNIIIALFFWEKIYNPLGEYVRFYSRKRLKELLRIMGFKSILEYREKHFGIISERMLIISKLRK